MAKTEKPIIKITRHTVDLDPKTDVFRVEITKGESYWPEVYNEHELGIFLKGIKCTFALMGIYLEIPGIPREATPELEKQTPLISDEDFDRCLKEGRKIRKKLEEALERQRWISGDDLKRRLD